MTNPFDNNQNSIAFKIENIQPILSVKDMQASRRFYIDILGFSEVDWGNNDFTGFNKDKTGIYLCRNGQGSPGTWIWIGFDADIFLLHQSLSEKGVKIKQPPLNFSWALEMHVEDPDGNVLRFGTDPDNNKPFLDKQTKNP